MKEEEEEEEWAKICPQPQVYDKVVQETITFVVADKDGSASHWIMGVLSI